MLSEHTHGLLALTTIGHLLLSNRTTQWGQVSTFDENAHFGEKQFRELGPIMASELRGFLADFGLTVNGEPRSPLFRDRPL
jgi:hypothetical protein